jgi:CheY-like chemotaxis protein
MYRPTAAIPIVACTAAVRQVRESKAYLLEQGIEVVLKPFGLDQLEGAVRRALQLDTGAASAGATKPRSSRRKPR